jgi:uncharacterized protein
MRILAISDLHGSKEALTAFAPRAAGADILLIAGDLTDFGGAKEARELLAILDGAPCRLAAVPGNCDRKGVRALLAAEGISADGRLVEAGGASIVGAGGSPLRTGITPYERPDLELSEALFRAISDASSRSPADETDRPPLVVLTHAPPKSSGADLRKGASLGSQALREALDRLAPPLWVCGHIHESPCASFSGRTLVLNPGSLREGRYAKATLERGGDGSWRAEAELLSLP